MKAACAIILAAFSAVAVKGADIEGVVTFWRSPDPYFFMETASGAVWRVRNRYLQVRDAYAALAAEDVTIDGYADYLAESAQANDERWPQSRSFAADVAVLKNFIVGHRAWLDIQFESITNLLESVRCDSQTSPWDGTVPKDGTAAFLR